MSEIHVRLAHWQKDNADLRRIREAVFIAEQAVPAELEWDDEDIEACLLYTSPSPRDKRQSRMPSSA